MRPDFDDLFLQSAGTGRPRSLYNVITSCTEPLHIKDSNWAGRIFPIKVKKYIL